MRHSRFPRSRTFRARCSHRFAFARYSRFFVGIAHEPTFPNGPHRSEANSIYSKVKSPTLGYLINQLLCGHGQPVVLAKALRSCRRSSRMLPSVMAGWVLVVHSMTSSARARRVGGTSRPNSRRFIAIALFDPREAEALTHD